MTVDNFNYIPTGNAWYLLSRSGTSEKFGLAFVDDHEKKHGNVLIVGTVEGYPAVVWTGPLQESEIDLINAFELFPVYRIVEIKKEFISVMSTEKIPVVILKYDL